MNLRDFYAGMVFDAYRFFGAHMENGGATFRTYAPNAAGVSVIGEFNGWREEPMLPQERTGIYSLFCPEAKPGMMYKYCVHTKAGRKVDHCDPYGFGMELRPNSASYLVDLSEYSFGDDEWMKNRSKGYDQPMNIYEVHLGSWEKNPEDENGWFHYNELAEKLIAYAKKFHYTHLELMPLSEHPADCSWGYQNTGFFSPTSRYGTARELMEFVDRCHQAGLGVIMDFVPVHFAVDEYALNLFDGTALYEYPHSDVGASEWGTLNFMHSRPEVRCFLQSAANYWLREYHMDGLRMDAVSRAIYWQGIPERGVNGNAVEFIRTMNRGLHRLHPSAILLAEDSTAFPKVTAPVEYDGLGFDYKWDLGWMNDTLDYFRTPPKERPQHYHRLTFSMSYFYNELYLLPFSHDEVVHGKATIIQKMWGDYEQKFPQARALYLYMFAHPGKKLNFMGNELAHFREWDEKTELDWNLLRYPLHDAFQQYIKRLGELYESLPALYEGEYNPDCFRWLVVDAAEESVYVFMRGTGKNRVLAAFNFSDMSQTAFPVPAPAPMELGELVSSDDEAYGGRTKPLRGKIRSRLKDERETLYLSLPPFCGKLYRVENFEE